MIGKDSIARASIRRPEIGRCHLKDDVFGFDHEFGLRKIQRAEIQACRDEADEHFRSTDGTVMIGDDVATFALEDVIAAAWVARSMVASPDRYEIGDLVRIMVVSDACHVAVHAASDKVYESAFPSTKSDDGKGGQNPLATSGQDSPQG